MSRLEVQVWNGSCNSTMGVASQSFQPNTCRISTQAANCLASPVCSWACFDRKVLPQFPRVFQSSLHSHRGLLDTSLLVLLQSLKRSAILSLFVIKQMRFVPCPFPSLHSTVSAPVVVSLVTSKVPGPQVGEGDLLLL